MATEETQPMGQIELRMHLGNSKHNITKIMHGQITMIKDIIG